MSAIGQTHSCFCFFSNVNLNGLSTAIQDNHFTILHVRWTKETYFPNGHFSAGNAAWNGAVYICGMIGYLADTIKKTLLAIGNTLYLFIALYTHDSYQLKKRALICLDSWAALGIALVGILCPPIAYYLDRKACEAMLTLVPTPELTSEII